MKHGLAKNVDELLKTALAEDVGPGDITSEACVPEGAENHGIFEARESGVCCGLEIIKRLFALIDMDVRVTTLKKEGELFEAGDILAEIIGPAKSILTGERLSLNIIQRMCAIATTTKRFVDKVEGTNAIILDTRKTPPLLRLFDRQAVRAGGGTNHRWGLSDQVLIKDNHLAMLGGDVARAVELARTKVGNDGIIEVEVESLENLKIAADAGADIVMLDNMTPETMRKGVEQMALRVEDGHDRPELEASGGINEQTVRAAAETGVDRISVGSLTHSVIALDIALTIDVVGV